MRPCVDSSGPADWCQFAGVGRRSPPASLQCRPAESTPVRRAYLLSMEASASPSLGHSEQISTRIFSAGKGHLKLGGGRGKATVATLAAALLTFSGHVTRQKRRRRTRGRPDDNNNFYLIRK